MDENLVLIVEDSEFLGGIVQTALEKNGYSSIWVKTYAEAINQLDNSETFFAAILDYSLPDAMEGEIIKTVLEYGIPSMVFTGHVSNKVRDHIWESNVVDYFLKNDKNSLQNIINQLNRLKRNDKIKVLVVDDSGFYRKVVSELLKVHKYDVLTANDGNEALEVIKDLGNEIKLVITDYKMPNMDGIRLVQEIRKLYDHNELGIIGISAEGENIMAVEFLKSGANDFVIKKRFLAEEFYSRVNQCLDKLENIRQIQEMNDHKNKLLGITAHDLRNPIGAIRGFVEILSEDDVDKETQDELLQLVRSISNDMLQMLNDLLDVSQIESGKFTLNLEHVDLVELIKNRIKLSGIYASKKDMKIHFISPEVYPLNFDKGKIGQVLDNFISNAIKYSPLGTEITCTLSEIDDSIRVGVKDQGPGIAEDELSMLFGEFSKLSTKATAGERSTGLGLAISKRIVEAHGGSIGVHSELGAGSEFYFELTP